MIKLLIWLCFAFTLLEYGRCEVVEAKCSPRKRSYENPQRDLCFVKDVKPNDSSDVVYNFELNHAEPDEILYLDLENVKFDHIPAKFFTDFPDMLQLRLDSNDLKELRREDFVNATKLTHLLIDTNRLTALRNDVLTQPALKTLEIVTIESNALAEIEDNSFDGLIKVHILRIRFNRLKTIRRNTFAGLSALDWLDLTHNQIDTIEDGALNLPRLTMLTMNNNNLHVLSDHVFDQLPWVRHIELDYCYIQHLGPSIYRMTDLSTVKLNYNHINDIDLVGFAKLPNLRTLELTQSGFTFDATNIDEELEWKSPLGTLDLDRNGLNNSVDLNKLRIFPNLWKLDLGYNSFTNLRLGPRKSIKDVLPNLRELIIWGMDEYCDIWSLVTQELKKKDVHVMSACS